MPQGLFPFKYEEEKTRGMTALAGLPLYLELAQAAGLGASIERHVHVRTGSQGWSDKQMLLSLLMLNLAGGDCVEDLALLQGDRGYTQVLRRIETFGMSRRQRRALERRWRKERTRAVPSQSAAFRYLSAFHDASQEEHRQSHAAFIPASNAALQGLAKVNADFAAFVQRRSPQQCATLDMDATLVETHKAQALYCYKKFRAYQPLNTYWAEQDLILHSEFRDGNVPAGFEQLRVLQEALAMLPQGVEKVCLRSDSAGYEQALLKYCAEGRNERFGVIEFAIAADVNAPFRAAALQVPQDEWKPLDGDQEYAEVACVPNWIGHSKHTPEYRFLAIREPLRQLELPYVQEEQSLPFPVANFTEKGRYKLFGIVTNRLNVSGDEVIAWHRQRCGNSEKAHAIMKDDLAGGQLPSADFGVNAAWWAIMILSLNLHVAMKRLVLGESWAARRMKALRLHLIALPGYVLHHARRLIVRLCAGHPSNDLVLRARKGILALSLPAG